MLNFNYTFSEKHFFATWQEGETVIRATSTTAGAAAALKIFINNVENK